jgi:hypothetical protein
MSRTAVAALLVLAAGCAPKLYFNQTFLVSEELKVTRTGYVSLKSTGEVFDLSPIRNQEPGAGDRILLAKVHGTYLVVGDGFRRPWRLWPVGGDAAKFEPIDLDPGAGGFQAPTLEMSGDCALLRWQDRQAFVNADGDVDEKRCPER